MHSSICASTMKTQGNMLSQTENSPATEQKHMEYYDLTDKAFKIAIMKKFNKLQENSRRQFNKRRNKNVRMSLTKTLKLFLKIWTEGLHE